MSAKIPSSATSYIHSPWKPKEDYCQGKGFIGIGKVVEFRFHTVTTKGDIFRFSVVVVDVTNVHNRTFHSKYQTEVEPNWKLDANGPNKVNLDEVMERIGQKSGGCVPPKLLEASYISKLHPKVKGRFEFWADPDVTKKLNLKVEDEIQFKTDGDSIFLVDLRRTGANFSGDGGEVLNQISKLSDGHLNKEQVLKQDLMEGVADEEWDD